MEWADASVWGAVAALPLAAEDSNLRSRLHHIHMVQRAFLHVWKALPYKPQAADFPDNTSLLNWALEYYPEATKYIGGLTEEDLEKPVVMPWIKMFEARMGRAAEVPTLHETLIQVAMHSAYHRGQVNTRLRELGGEPPLTDFIAWVWSGKPRPDWPLTA
jgi:uncharacterized damage-inducible protein DinB